MKKYRTLALLPGLMILSNVAHALGLGDIQVRSYLGQPIAARIQLISTSRQELVTVTAGLAAASDYEFVGMKQNLSVPLRFVIDSNPDNPGIEVSSRLPVREPVVQFVVEVSWSGGRMLKEYTVFLDPPTVASSAPAPAVYTRADPPPEEFPDPGLVDVVETVKPEPRPVEAVPVESEPTAIPETPALQQAEQDSPAQDFMDEESAAAVEPAVTVPFDTAAPPGATEAIDGSPPPELDATPPGAEPAVQVATAEESGTPGAADPEEAVNDTPVREEPAETPPAVPAPRAASSIPATGQGSGEPYGPVQRGDTLWSIASRHTEGTEFSINQAMLAIQRMNPDAFGGNNINSLKSGVILRMPAATEMRRMDKRQAMLEAMRQEQVYASMRAGIPVQDEPPVLADLALEPVEESTTAAASSNRPEDADDGRLELVPPSEGLGQSAATFGPDAATGAISSEELSETLARTEEELANAQQENEYLAQRIRELEAQLAERRGAIESRDLAEMESSLREDRLSGEEEPELRVAQPAGQAWYEGKLGWIIGVLLLLVAAVTWFLRRLAGRATDAPDSESATVVKIRSEAEEILETLDGEDDSSAEPEDEAATHEDPGGSEPGPSESPGRPGKPVAGPAEDSEVIELDTSDPETRLDLARAYISMNDQEAARQMLEEVLETGDENQVREARDMMQELESQP